MLLYFKYLEEGQTPEQFRENLASLEEIGFPLPPEEEWPPLYEDLPYEGQEAMRIFYTLPIKVDGMAGYTGRDLSCLSTLYDIYEVPVESRKTILNLIVALINDSVKSAAQKIKREQEQQARKRD